MLPLLAMGSWIYVFYAMHGTCLLSLGKAHYKAFGNVAQFLYILDILPLCIHIAKAPGAILAICLKDIPTYLWVVRGSQKEGIYSIKQDMYFTGLLIALVMIFIYFRIKVFGEPSLLKYLQH